MVVCYKVWNGFVTYNKYQDNILAQVNMNLLLYSNNFCIYCMSIVCRFYELI